jgi:hypothetical protein
VGEYPLNYIYNQKPKKDTVNTTYRIVSGIARVIQYQSLEVRSILKGVRRRKVRVGA